MTETRRKESRRFLVYTGKPLTDLIYDTQDLDDARRPKEGAKGSTLHPAVMALLETLRDAKRPLRKSELVALMKEKALTGVTKQDPGRIVDYWKKALVTHGWVTVVKESESAVQQVA